MKSLILLALLATGGPALAETQDNAPESALFGRMIGASKGCMATCIEYQNALRDCMDRLKAEADARAGQTTSGSTQGNRSRYLRCDATLRKAVAAAAP